MTKLLMAATAVLASTFAITAHAQTFQSGSYPRIGTPGSNVLFGGSAGAPRQIESSSAFGNTAESVFSTGGRLFGGGTTRSDTGGLAGTVGASGTGGLVGTGSSAPTGGLSGSLRTAADGGTRDLGTVAGTGGIATLTGASLLGNTASGGLSDGAGPSVTGGR